VKRRRTAVIVGSEDYAGYLAKLINEHGRDWEARAFSNSRLSVVGGLWALRDADALICAGGPGPNVALAEFARRRNVPVVVIWTGNDVTIAAANPAELDVTKSLGFIHLADGPWLVGELRALGIEAEYLPVTGVRSGGSSRPLPERFTVLTYLPEPRRDFYGRDAVYAIARAFPDADFFVAGRGGADHDAPQNVRFLGHVDDLRERLDASTVLLRLPEHDGKPMMVLEALARARHVVWTYPLPAVRTVASPEEAHFEVRALLERHRAGTLEPNKDGRIFALRNFSRAQICEQLEDRLDTAVSRRGVRRKPSQRVAISGLGLFCASVAEQLQKRDTGWEPCILRTSSRLEVLTSVVNLMRSDLWYSIGSPVSDRWVDMAARFLRKPRVLHWVGTDIETIRRAPELRKHFIHDRVTHLTEVQWTANELRSYGIDSHIVPLAPRSPAGQVYPLPSTFTILLYVPRTRAAFYGRLEYERLMQHFAGKPVRFLVVGGGQVKVPPGVDVRNLGWRDQLDGPYRDSTVLLRFTPRDGLSLMVLEALSYGRYVLWSQDFSHSTLVQRYEDIERELDMLLASHLRGELQPRTDAAEMIRRQYDVGCCLDRIIAAWRSSLSREIPQTQLEVVQ